MLPVDAPSSGDAFPTEAIEAFRRTAPWLVFVAIMMAVAAGGAICIGLYMVFMASNANTAPYMMALQGDGSLAMLIGYGLLEVLMAIMLFRLAFRISSLSVSDTSQLSLNLDHVCRRQLQLWAILAIVFGAGLVFDLFYLVELATHTA